tara:strand:+ start:380 stop:703 length:324 start_codon:yes stop_codon:yes gene_type:complete
MIVRSQIIATVGKSFSRWTFFALILGSLIGVFTSQAAVACQGTCSSFVLSVDAGKTGTIIRYRTSESSSGGRGRRKADARGTGGIHGSAKRLSTLIVVFSNPTIFAT